VEVSVLQDIVCVVAGSPDLLSTTWSGAAVAVKTAVSAALAGTSVREMIMQSVMMIDTVFLIQIPLYIIFFAVGQVLSAARWI
jgi:hypothetical protein